VTEPTYTVTKRGPKGEPLEIRCAAHRDCTWRMAVTGPRRDDDPILMAQFREHLSVASEPDRAAFGHLRRSRK
jgi:hypothetical protein